MSEKALPCIVCGVELDNAWREADNQPSDGTAFTTEGHYGSTFFDPMDGQILEITVCDECLEKNKARIAWCRLYKWVKCGGVIVGKEYLDRPLVPYTGEDDDPAAVVEIDPNDLGNPDWGRFIWATSRFEFATRCYINEASDDNGK